MELGPAAQGSPYYRPTEIHPSFVPEIQGMIPVQPITGYVVFSLGAG